MSAYNLDNIEELVQFDKDCLAAAKECPQCFLEEYIQIDKRISIAEVFCYWFENSILWNSGYNTFLSERAKLTFQFYSVFRDGAIHRLGTGQIFNQKMKFKVKLIYGKENNEK